MTPTEGKVAGCLEQWASSESVESCLGLKNLGVVYVNT